MIEKTITFSSALDECSVEKISPSNDDGKLIKTASEGVSPEIKKFVEKNIKEDPRFVYVLVCALGSGEYWGPNVNSDYFEEEEIKRTYKTFEEFGYAFKHHKNKDPNNSIGRIMLSHWNDRMHRVELVVRLDRSLAPNICRDIDRGKMWDVSMGCKVPYDVCSICGNVARTKDDYCDHITMHKGKVLPGGKQVYMINKNPRFFDISFVFIGADRTAKTLMKIASQLGVNYQELIKKSDIEKDLPGDIISTEAGHMASLLMQEFNNIKQRERTMPTSLLDRMSSHNLQDVLTSLMSLGIILKPHEFQRIVLSKMGENPDYYTDTFDPNVNLPQSDSLNKFKPLSGNVEIQIIKTASPMMEDRSAYKQYLYPRLIKMASYDYPEEEPQKYNPSAAKTLAIPMLATAAGLYKKYLDEVPDYAAEGLDAKIKEHPWLLPMLVTGSIAGIHGMNARDDQDDMYERSKLASIEKTAGNLGGRMLMGVPAAYVASDIARKSESDNKLIDFIGNHPNLTALLGVAATNTADDWEALKKAFTSDIPDEVLNKEAAAMISPEEPPEKIYEQTQNLYDRYQNLDKKYGKYHKAADMVLKANNPKKLFGSAVDTLAGKALFNIISNQGGASGGHK